MNTPDTEQVIDAEVLTDEENEEVSRRFAQARADAETEAETGGAIERRQPGHLLRRATRHAVLALRRAALTVGRPLAVWWGSEPMRHARSVAGYRGRQAPRDVVRLVWFVLRGHLRWAGKAWTFLTYGDLRADARNARLAGDPQARRAAQEMIRVDSRARWARLAMATEHLRAGLGVAGAAALVLWLIDSIMQREQMWPWLAGSYTILATGWRVATAAAPYVATLAALAWLVAAAFEGRDLTPGAGWLVRPDRDDADSWVDERMISQALAHLGIAPLDRFFAGGGELAYIVPARLDGAGTYAQVRLPMGVTADMVADRRDRLAANLGRAKLETWPTEAHEAGVLDLWVPTRAPSAAAPGHGHCCTTERSTSSTGCRSADPNAARCSQRRCWNATT